MNNLSRLKIFILAASFLTLSACGNGKNNKSDGFPDNFNSLDDAAKVAFIMKNASPDSVARFICNASLGKNPKAKIDTLAIASAYAYENYKDSDLLVFSKELDDYSANLPLDDKMKIYMMSGTIDPQGLGYELGLEYVNHIREEKMTIEEIIKELDAFKKACGNDSTTYIRFLKGFKTVLRIDHGKDLREDIYKHFIDY